MNVYTHALNKQKDLSTARRMQFAGILLIAVSFVMSLFFAANVLLVYLAYPFLLVGFPVWMIGRRQLRRLGGAPAVEQTITEELKGFSDKYSLHHNPTVEGKQVDHLMITPAGVIVMEDNPAVGYVSCTGGPKGDRWSTRTNMLDRLMGSKPSIGNPTVDTDAAVAAVKSFMQKNGKPNVPVRGLTVFLANPDIEIEESTYPAVPLNELKMAVRELEDDMGGEKEDTRSIDRILTSDDRRKLNAALGTPAPAPKPAKTASARS